MKKLVLALIGVSMLSIASGSGQEQVTLTDGRVLLLQEDGTYEFIQPEEHVVLAFTGVGPHEDFRGTDDSRAEVEYRVDNNGYGSLYQMRFEFGGLDDRGNPVEGSAFGSTQMSQSVVPVGGSTQGSFTLEVSPEYLETVLIGEVSPFSFNMRELPNGVRPIDLVRLKNETDEIKLRMAE